MFTFTHTLRVRYAETDQMGYVYYGNYLTYYEVCRVESLRSIGISYRKLEEEGIILPVLENHSKYLEPARYDENLTIHVRIEKLPGIKIEFFYDIYNGNKRLIHQGNTVLAFINKNTGKPIKPPETILEVLRPYFSNAK